MIERWCVNCETTIQPDQPWIGGVLQGQVQAWHETCPDKTI